MRSTTCFYAHTLTKSSLTHLNIIWQLETEEISMNMQSSRHRSIVGDLAQCSEKDRTTTGAMQHCSGEDDPNYNDIEHDGSDIVEAFRTLDNTHRKLRSRHIQLIG